MKYEFYQVDVFSNVPFGGNPLAVVLNAEKLTPVNMQKIAKEMNLSETTFVLPSNKHSANFSIRIFTPEKEIPFAGHPVLGAAHILREKNKVPIGIHPIKLSMNAGIVTITQRRENNLLFMTQLSPEFKLASNCVKQICAALGISKTAINESYPIQIVSTGLPVLITPIKTLNIMINLAVDINKLKEILSYLGIDMIYAYTLETINNKATVHSRAFAPALGINEDPATGSAAGALGAYLFKNSVISIDICENIIIEQGHHIGRPSSLYVIVEHAAKKIESVLVGGDVVTLIEGQINV